MNVFDMDIALLSDDDMELSVDTDTDCIYVCIDGKNGDLGWYETIALDGKLLD